MTSRNDDLTYQNIYEGEMNASAEEETERVVR